MVGGRDVFAPGRGGRAEELTRRHCGCRRAALAKPRLEEIIGAACLLAGNDDEGVEAWVLRITVGFGRAFSAAENEASGFLRFVGTARHFGSDAAVGLGSTVQRLLRYLDGAGTCVSRYPGLGLGFIIPPSRPLSLNGSAAAVVIYGYCDKLRLFAHRFFRDKAQPWRARGICKSCCAC